jgi:phenylacetate-CoA ligase
MNLHPDIERQSATEVSSFQFRRLVELLQYTSERSPFYKRRFAEINFRPASIESVADVRRIPVTTKDDLQQFNWDFLCVPKSVIAEYASTSGTLGKPVTVALTRSDLQRLAYNEAISFTCADGSSSDIFQLMLTLDRQFMAGIAYYEGIKLLGASTIRVGPGVPAMQLESIQRLKPTTLVAVPSFLVKLISYAKDHHIDLNKTSVTKAVCIGESIRDQDFSFNVIGKKIREHWNIRLYGTYASTEMQTAFTECSAGRGGHLHPELLYIELLDEAGSPVEEGQPGEVTITTLGVEGMPLIRYKTGDVAVAHTGMCSCGRTTLRLGPIAGRKQQQVKLKGTTIYPPGIFDILNEMEFVSDYVVEVYTGELGTDELRLHVTVNGEITDAVVNHLNNVFQSRLRVLPQIDFTSPGLLEKMLHGSGERKVRRFIDNR